MKILLTNFHDRNGGGHDTYILAIARGLSAGHQVFIAAPGTSRLIRLARALPGITAVPMDFPAKIRDLSRMPAALRAFRALMRQERFDVIHANGSPDHRLLLLTLWRRARRSRIVFTKHNSIRIKSDILTRLRSRRATDAVVAVSDSAAQLVRQSVYARCPLAIVKPGIDLTRFAPQCAVLADAKRREMFGAECAKRLVIGTVTGFDSYKGTMDMIEAVAALPVEVRTKVMVVVVGAGPDHGQRQRIDSLGMQDHVHAVGFVENVVDFIATFDAGFVLSFAVESISFACREMMAMGKPVIVTRYAGLPENVDDGVNGWIVEPRDVEGLGQTLRAIIAARSQLAEMGQLACLKALNEFSGERFVHEMEGVYRRVAYIQ